MDILQRTQRLGKEFLSWSRGVVLVVVESTEVRRAVLVFLSPFEGKPIPRELYQRLASQTYLYITHDIREFPRGQTKCSWRKCLPWGHT